MSRVAPSMLTSGSSRPLPQDLLRQASVGREDAVFATRGVL